MATPSVAFRNQLMSNFTKSSDHSSETNTSAYRLSISSTKPQESSIVRSVSMSSSNLKAQGLACSTLILPSASKVDHPSFDSSLRSPNNAPSTCTESLRCSDMAWYHLSLLILASISEVAMPQWLRTSIVLSELVTLPSVSLVLAFPLIANLPTDATAASSLR